MFRSRVLDELIELFKRNAQGLHRSSGRGAQDQVAVLSLELLQLTEILSRGDLADELLGAQAPFAEHLDGAFGDDIQAFGKNTLAGNSGAGLESAVGGNL